MQRTVASNLAIRTEGMAAYLSPSVSQMGLSFLQCPLANATEQRIRQPLEHHKEEEAQWLED